MLEYAVLVLIARVLQLIEGNLFDASPATMDATICNAPPILPVIWCNPGRDVNFSIRRNGWSALRYTEEKPLVQGPVPFQLHGMRLVPIACSPVFVEIRGPSRVREIPDDDIYRL